MTGSLSLQALSKLPADVVRPGYEITSVRPGIVHLGAGAFHRAHQAVYTDDLLNAGADSDWAITAVSMRRPDVADALNRQQGLYTITEYDQQGAGSLRVIAAIREALVLATSPGDVFAAIARPETRVVTLTVTEKAYYRRGDDGGLDCQAEAVRRDLESGEPKRSAVGALVAGLERRRDARTGPVTVVCCDNLPHNGAVLSRLCQEFAGRWRPGLETWIEERVSFPCSMVDRITPATTSELIAATAERLGCEDAAPVACEAFRQWVIEDRFVAGRPPWGLGGAQFVADVRPFEEMKLRMLNASHSALAYLGLQAGKQFVHEALEVVELRNFIARTMACELEPTIHGVSASELEAYRAALLRRFESPRPAHRLYQIAEDGSQKLPIRVLDPLREQLRAGRPCDGLTLIIAAWLEYLEQIASGVLPGPLNDPLADRLAVARGSRLASEKARALEFIFGPELLANRGFLERLDGWQQRLSGRGPVAALHAAGYGN